MSLPEYQKYTTSQFPWLGRYPACWSTTNPHLSGIKICTGKVDVNIQDENGDYPFFTCGREVKRSSMYSFDCEALLVAGNGEVGFTQYVNGKFEAYQRTYVLSNFSNWNPHYLRYYFSSLLLSALADRSVGSVIQFVTLGDLRHFPLCRPSLEEQRLIVEFLDNEIAKIDALITEQQRLIELLNEKRKALISHAVTKGLDPDAQTKDSGIEWLGKVPRHWQVLPVKRVLSDIKAGPFGSSLTKDMYVESGIRVYGQEQVIAGDFEVGDYYIPYSAFGQVRQYATQAGDVLLSCVGSVGRLALVPQSAEPGIINPRLLRLRVASGISSEYLVHYLSSPVCFEQFSALTRGGTMDVINGGTIAQLVIPLPPPIEQSRIIEAIERCQRQSKELETQAELTVQLLRERRSALISAAVTGKIDVRGLASAESKKKVA